MPLPLFQHPSNGLPLLTTGSASPVRLRGYSWVHLRYGLLSCCLETHNPVSPRRRFLMLPGRTDNSPGRDFNPLDLLLLLRTVRHDIDNESC